MKYGSVCVLIFCWTVSVYPLKLTRVILSTDANPDYIQFWPVVAKAWREVVGVRPTLALIADSSVHIDESLGDVIRFDPIPGISTAFQAQTIRMLLPAFFEKDVCITSDIDLIPLNRNYFRKGVRNERSDQFVVFRVDGPQRYAMCYNAGYGKVFKEIFGVRSMEDIPRIMHEWWVLNWGWISDELILYKYVHAWHKRTKRALILPHHSKRRLNRKKEVNLRKVRRGEYNDYHCPRPYNEYRQWIGRVVQVASSRKHSKRE